MEELSIASITLSRVVDGSLVVNNRWNPSAIYNDERKKVAKFLREVANGLENNEFEDGGVMVKHSNPRKKSDKKYK